MYKRQSRGKPEAGRKKSPPENKKCGVFLYLPIFYTKSNKGKESGEMKKKLTYHNFYFYLLLLSPILVVYIPVSYTHLDVYKRQVWMCMESVP